MALTALIAASVLVSGTAFGQAISTSQVKEGFRISPIPKSQLNLKGKNQNMVGMGSYLVNALGDCSGCHSFPRFLAKGDTAGSNPAAGDPYDGIPSDQSNTMVLSANYNTQHYLSGGQCFGPFMARNLTPDPTSGLPENLTQDEFIKALRTGADVTCSKPQSPLDLHDRTAGPRAPGDALGDVPQPDRSGPQGDLRLSERAAIGESVQYGGRWMPRLFRDGIEVDHLYLQQYERLSESASAAVA